MKRPIGLMGGTFDPVHNGHVVLATTAIERLALSRLIVIPALQSPHKAARPSASPQIRLELLRLAFAHAPLVEVSEVELRRSPPSYTVDTVIEMERAHPGHELVLLLGFDALADFPKWRSVPRIVQSCRLAVFRRPGSDQAVIEEVRRAVPGIRVEPIDTPLIEISSTLVRERVRAGLPLAGLVPNAVAGEITRQRLYAGA